MNKKIAIVTGASAGIGKEFTRVLLNENLDEVWAIARNKDNLQKLKSELGDKITMLSLDLSDNSSFEIITKKLAEEKPQIEYLINNAGIAKFGRYDEFSLEEIRSTINLNCIAIVSMCTICIPYMKRGGHIINLSSASSFQPLPFLNLYGSTKVFERHYSRALNRELKPAGIVVTAVCPSWVDTDLLIKEANNRKIKFKGMVSVTQVVAKAMKDAKKGKDMSVCSSYVKSLHFFTKIYPQRVSMNAWLRMSRDYIDYRS